jgi:anti-sigma-K factor RskA
MNGEGAQERRDDNAMAAEYALGVLPHAERQTFARRLESDAALRDKVRFWEMHFASLAEEIAPATPPAHLRGAIEKTLFAAGTTPATGWWQSLALWRGVSLASLAGLVVAVGLLARGPETAPEPGPSLVSELRSETGAVNLVVLYDARKGELRLNRTQGTAATGRDFELWLIEGGNAPVSLGVLPASATGILPVREALRAKLENSVLAISDEPAGGSPTGQATGTVLATGKVTEI